MKKLFVFAFILMCVIVNAQNEAPIFYLPFNGNTIDETGNGNDAVNYGATLTTDRFGNPNSAYEFDGVDDYMQISPVSDLSAVGDYSISLWFLHKNWKGTVQTNNIERQYIFDAHASTSSATGNNIFRQGFVSALDFNYSTNSENLLVYDLYQIGPFRYYEAKSQSYSLSDEWQFITMQRVGANYELYLNGELVSISKSTASSDPSDELLNMMHNLFIGSFAGNNPEYYFKGYNFSGKIDDINFYTRALLPCEIQQLYTPNNGDVETNLVSISGTVYIENGLCTEGTARLFKFVDSEPQLISKVQLVNGTYIFENVESGQYIVQIIPGPSIKGYLPTFSNNSLSQKPENSFIVGTSSVINDITLSKIPGKTPGKCSIKGNVNTLATSDKKDNSNTFLKEEIIISIENAIVYLIINDEIIEFTAPDNTGEFEFADLENGNYTIVIECLGDIYKSENIAAIENNIESIIYSEFIIYPNPSSETITIQALDDVTSITLYNEIGSRIAIYEISKNKTINVTSLPQGIYYIQPNTGGLYKLIKK